MDSATNLNRFIEAQNSPGYAGYNQAMEEIRRGKKLSHWIRYVFPQLKSINQSSSYDNKYGIENLEEAKAYLNNSTLRKRLDDICEILLKHEGKTASSIFGVTDSARVRSSMTLFYLASNNVLYKQVLDKYYNGHPCQNTLYALNMKMPESPSPSKTENNRKQESPRERKRHTFTTRPQQFVSASRLKSLRRRKMKKMAILIAGFISVIALFGGMGYGVYYLLTGHNEPVVTEADFERPYSNNIDLHVDVTVLTSDQETITFNDKEKYSMSLMASLGNNIIPLDSSTSKFHFLYNNENSSEEIKIDAKVETCKIGEQTYSLSKYDAKEGLCDEMFNLDVSRGDLRIYEELAWYQSANQKVSSTRYPKYVKRIKDVQNKEFAALLTQKLSSIEREVESKKKEEAEKNDSVKRKRGVLSAEIRHCVQNLKPIPVSYYAEMEGKEKIIIQAYNREIGKNRMIIRKDHHLQMLLRDCSTFSQLDYLTKRIREKNEEKRN